MNERIVVRLAVAGTWLEQGAWKKVLGRDPEHRAIVAAVPGLGPDTGAAVTRGIGVLETALGAWVLSGRRTRLAARTQTILLLAMNAGGLVFARALVPRPGRMVVRNLVFLCAVWSLA